MTKTIFTLNTYTEVLFILITSLFTRIFYGSKGILTVEGAGVLPVRMCNRRDAIPPVNTDVRYILTVCLPVLDFFYNIICH